MNFMYMRQNITSDAPSSFAITLVVETCGVPDLQSKHNWMFNFGAMWKIMYSKIWHGRRIETQYSAVHLKAVTGLHQTRGRANACSLQRGGYFLH